MGYFKEIIQYTLFTIGGTPVNVATFAIAIILAVLSFFMARLADHAISRFLRIRGVKDEGSIGATSRLVHYSVLAVGLTIAVQTLGINLTALFAAGAFLAIALAFATQNLTQNFVSGLILLLERSIKPGDIIEVEGRVVKITKLGMRATVVRTWDSEDFIIPNSILVSSTVKNFTLQDKLFRIRSLVGVTYGSDMKKVREVLDKTTRSLPWRVTTFDPIILMKEFGNSSVDFDVSVWVDDPFTRAISQSRLNEAIWFALKKAGITIAFPQLDLHLDEASNAALRTWSAGDGHEKS